MKFKFLEHLLSTALVAALLLGLMAYFRAQDGEGAGRAAPPPEIADYAQWDFLDLNDAFGRALFADFLTAYRPGEEAGNERTLALLEAVAEVQADLIADPQESISRGVTSPTDFAYNAASASTSRVGRRRSNAARFGMPAANPDPPCQDAPTSTPS